METFWDERTSHWDHLVPGDKLNQAAFELMCLVGASKSIPNEWAKTTIPDRRIFGSLFESEIRSAIVEKMLRLAIAFRSCVDHYGKTYDETKISPVGFVKSEDVRKNLYVREACNKIIHAESIQFECIEHGDEQPTFNGAHILYRFSGSVRVDGKINFKKVRYWTAEFDLLKLCDSAIFINSGLWRVI